MDQHRIKQATRPLSDLGRFAHRRFLDFLGVDLRFTAMPVVFRELQLGVAVADVELLGLKTAMLSRLSTLRVLLFTPNNMFPGET